ncbi:MAG: serine/threonine protein kinase [Deltaproteobacteria bacterium]|nr:serine/threonine protein kinase [Deltaproteobacteria bacterium]MBW2253826.1 serine/threonine protein kinase [Deltaproteobacteria bacterium]
MPASYCPRCLTTFSDNPETCPNLSCGGDRPKTAWGALLEEGDLLDRHYRIRRSLAVGGAGITYLALEVDADGRPQPPDLAIKVLYTARDSGPFLRRLSNEAQILQELSHDHIVECRGFVHRTGHAPYLVTLYENGGSLAQHVERVGALPPPIAVGVLKQVLLALDVAHQRGVIHRDLKPDNVLLGEKVGANTLPWVRVTDFGIAKVFGGVGSRLTRLGAFVGTPEYAAPEQFEGMTPTPATDVYAAGALLYYLLCGTQPVQFTQRMDIEQCYEELLDQIPPKLPEQEGPPGPWALAQRVLDQTMHPRQGDRWTVQQILSHISPLAPSEGPRRPTRVPATFAFEAPPPPDVLEADGAPTVPPSEDGRRPASPPHDEPHPPPNPDSHEEERAPLERTPQEPGRRGGVLGAAGLVLVLVVGGTISVMLLAVGAWAMGWFGPATSLPDTTVPVQLPAVEVTGTTRVVEGSPAEVRSIDGALRAAAKDLAMLCHPKEDVPLALVVEPTGAVRTATADPRVLAKDEGARCVESAVKKLSLPRSGKEPIRVRVTIPF